MRVVPPASMHHGLAARSIFQVFHKTRGYCEGCYKSSIRLSVGVTMRVTIKDIGVTARATDQFFRFYALRYRAEALRFWGSWYPGHEGSRAF